MKHLMTPACHQMRALLEAAVRVPVMLQAGNPETGLRLDCLSDYLTLHFSTPSAFVIVLGAVSAAISLLKQAQSTEKLGLQQSTD